MGECYWCYWGWPKPIRDIYDDARNRLGSESALHYGPAHVVWDDENFDSAQWCLDNFDKYSEDLSEREKEIVRESLVKLLGVPDEFKHEPSAYLEDETNSPKDFPPPPNWEVHRRV